MVTFWPTKSDALSSRRVTTKDVGMDRALALKERTKSQNNNATHSGFESVFVVHFYNNITPSGFCFRFIQDPRNITLSSSHPKNPNSDHEAGGARAGCDPYRIEGVGCTFRLLIFDPFGIVNFACDISMFDGN
jgi:hypothetical protein